MSVVVHLLLYYFYYNDLKMLWNRQWQTTTYDADIIDVDGTYATGSTKFDAMKAKETSIE